MNTIDALLTRVSNPYLAEPFPSKKKMDVVYQSAFRAPDHAWLRPWRFIEITGDGRLKLAKAFVKSASKNEKLSKEMSLKISAMPYRAPMIIVIAVEIIHRLNVPAIEQVQSTAAATQNMLLALHDMGFAGFWRTGKFVSHSNPYIAEELSLSKKTKVLGYIYIGKTNAKGKEIPKLQNNDFVSYWNK